MGCPKVIYDSLRSIRNFTRHDGELGLELETETLAPYDIPQMKYWTTHVDNSLRDFGIEYVLKSPLRYEGEIPTALEEFKISTNKIDFKKDPVSASCHIHVNMLNETYKTMGNFLSLYTLFENLLIRYSGPNRLSNLFCLPILDAEETAANIKRLWRHIASKNYRGILEFTEGVCKYASLNLSALPTRGSLEVRSFRGSTDVDEIQDWIDIVYSPLVFARQDISPVTILDEYQKKGAEFGLDVFGKHFKKLEREDQEQLIKSNLWYLQDSIVYAVPDWNEVDKLPEPKKKFSTKELNSISQNTFRLNFDQLASGQQEYVVNVLQQSNLVARYLSGDYLNPAPTLNRTQVTEEAHLRHPNDVILVYRPRNDEDIEILRSNLEDDDEIIEVVQWAA